VPARGGGRVLKSWQLLKQAAGDWRRDNAARLGAALSYYTLFSVAPLLVVAIGVAGLAFGREAAQGQIVTELHGLVGEAGARAVQDMVEASRRPQAGILATVIGVATLLLGATGAFAELKSALNVVWDVPDQRGGLRALLLGRLWSFAMVLAIGFLLMVSLVLSAAIAAADGFFHWMGVPPAAAQLANAAVSFVVITVLFALIFKFLPDTEVAWSDVWAGAVFTSALFAVGKAVIGLYLGRSGLASVYGAAGSVVVLVVWVYYAAQIFFFGAEMTQAYARRHGSRQHDPVKGAIPA
jgi:membrane protein